jgi:hypothetical protein
VLKQRNINKQAYKAQPVSTLTTQWKHINRKGAQTINLHEKEIRNNTRKTGKTYEVGRGSVAYSVK